MNKIPIAAADKTDVSGITSITISDQKFVSVIYGNGRTVQYLYNPHFDKDEFGKTQWEKEHDPEIDAIEFHDRIRDKGWT